MVTVASGINLPIKIVIPYFKGCPRFSLNIDPRLIGPSLLLCLYIEGVGFSMIGLGDIVLPGLFTAFLLRFDRGRNDANDLYFTTAMVGYAFGLAMCLLTVVHLCLVAPPFCSNESVVFGIFTEINCSFIKQIRMDPCRTNSGQVPIPLFVLEVND